MSDLIELPFPLIADISEGRCIPFIGAGFSRNAVVRDGTMPDWHVLARHLASESGLDHTLAGPEIAQEFERHFGRVQLVEAVRRALHVDDARPGRCQLAFAQLPFDTVYTTNFDLLLESAYSTTGRPFRSLVGELQLPFHAGQTATNIVKMHGDLRHEEHIVLTRHDYSSFLERYPVIATHLSAMLITRTPLFIGYSLTDPDFISIRDVVRSRLGKFERMSYVIQFDANPNEIDSALEERIHIVNILSGGHSRDQLLEQLLLGVQSKLDSRASGRLRLSRPDVFEDISPQASEPTSDKATSAALVESTSKLCFVMMPFSESYDVIYRNLIVPAVIDTGLVAVRADEIPATGFIMEQIRAAIQQSRVCIADLTDRNSNVLYEVGFAEAMRKPVILIASDLSQLPFDFASQRVFRYSTDLENSKLRLREAIAHTLTEDRFGEAEKLLASGSPRGSIALSAVILEHILRELSTRRNVSLPSRISPATIALALENANVIDSTVRMAIQEASSIRNQAIHSMEHEPSHEEAQFVLNTAKRIAEIR
jgi:nucleoside 2-deoxyribosyltransferase